MEALINKVYIRYSTSNIESITCFHNSNCYDANHRFLKHLTKWISTKTYNMVVIDDSFVVWEHGVEVLNESLP